MVDPLHMHFNAIPPPVHIEAIRADLRDHVLADTVEFPPLTRDIEISYTALSFAAPQKVQFRYRLSRFDRDWHDVGARRQAVYTNLKPGTYTFQVLAANNDGVWNEAGASLVFSILPAWYETIWFRSTCVGVFALLLWDALPAPTSTIEAAIQYAHRRASRRADAHRSRLARYPVTASPWIDV
jgi:hypothetical protein